MKKGLFLVIALLAGGVLIASLATAQLSRASQTIDVEPLLGSSEVPGPGDADGSGTASLTVDVDTDEVCLDVSALTNVTLPINLAHVHVGTVGNSGSPVVSFLSAPDADGIFNICVTDSDADAIAADPAGYYINLHNDDFPNGAVRGQLIAPAVPTDTPTETATTVPEETATPTATPTEEPGVELIANGGFETDVLNWTLKASTADKTKCDTADKVVSHTGVCAFRFKGGVGEASKLVQTVDLTSLVFVAGQTLDMSAYIAAKKASASGKFKLVVAYGDSTASSKTTALIFQTVDGGYELVTGSETVTISSATVSKIKLQIKHTSPAGKVYLDDVSVLWNPSPVTTPEVLPLDF
jgi:hypothetical protein